MTELNDHDLKLVSGAWGTLGGTNDSFALVSYCIDHVYPFLVDAVADALCAATGKCEP